MRILQLHNQYRHYGGEDAVVQNEMSLLTQNGVAVRQVLFENEQIRAGRLIHNQNSYDRVYAEIESFEPDVVHVHNLFYEASPAVLKAAKDLGKPVVMTLHNYRLLCAGALFLRNGRACTKCKQLTFPVYGITHKCFQGSYFKSAALSALIGLAKMRGIWDSYVDRFIVLTPFIKELIESSSLKVSPEKVVVKPNSTDDMHEGLEKTRLARRGYLFVGRLAQEKGPGLLLETFQGLPDEQLTIIGDGPMDHELRKRAGENVRFLGRQGRNVIKKELLGSKALLFPSLWYEGLPNTIIEAFSAATPVVATDIENVNTIIQDGYNGLLFPKGSQQGLKDKLRSLDEKMVGQLGQQARKTYERHYTHERNYAALMHIYESLIHS